MAERIPYAVAASLINRLGSAAIREYGRINGVMDELERLKNTVESIRAVLLDAEKKQEAQNHAVQNWVRRLRDVLIPADDLLDEFVIEDMRHKRDKSDKKKNTNSVRRETSSYVIESDIIGREDDKNEVINLLRQPHGNNNVSPVAIVGIGGLGKTALAQLVYNDREVKEIFEKIMWVCVSENFDVKTILKNALKSLLPMEKIDDTLSLDNLQNMLRDKLTGKRYLLVLDDVWSESFEKWVQLRTYLMCGAQGSRVLVTTRTKLVAQTMGVSDPYVLKGLTLEESWGLLKNFITYGDETKGVNQNLEPIGKKIAEKCCGVPLAIRTLGGLLQGKSEEREWIDILQGDLWKLCEDEESIMPLLKLSYQNLSPQLRQCFAYCSLYPKNWEIMKNGLIKLWMAQGYLECLDEKQLTEDIGNQFVKIFLMKSFFQDPKINRHGDILSFKMHDLIHDLAMQVARNDCCFLDTETKRLVGSPMHIMLKSDAFGLLESLDASRMRTLILLNTISKNLNEKELFVISKFKCLRVLKLSDCSLIKLCDSIGNLKHLRYLNLSGCQGLGILSKSISNLVCLQTLILKQCKEVEFSTKDISKLINLRRLDIENLKVVEQKKTTSRFGKLGVGEQYNNSVIFSNWFSSLTNIVEIYLKGCHGLKYLPPMERLPFLKSLSIHHLNELEFIYYEEPLLSESFFPSLEKLTVNMCIQLRGWRRMRDDVNDDDNNSSESYHLSFPCLSELNIRHCSRLTHMPTFSKLDKALSLSSSRVELLEATLNMVGSKCSIEFTPLSMLKYLRFGGYDLNLKKLPKNWVQNLTSLKDLVLYDLKNEQFQEIEIWFKDNLDYLTFLENITLSHCEDLEGLPDWICNLSSLHHMKLEYCKCLASLPMGICHLTVVITECPLLLGFETWFKMSEGISNPIILRVCLEGGF